LPHEADVRQAVVQRLLGPLLTSPHLVKVVHAPQEAAGVLQQQYGVELQGVLDTCELAEAVAAAGGSPAAGEGVGDSSLASLHEQYGFIGADAQILQPLCGEYDGQMLENAAIRVRYLLPLAAALLQQLPAAGPAAAGGQLISQATAQRLSQLSQQLEALKGVPLPPAGNQPQWVAGVGVTFELVCDQQHRPSYQLYIGPVQQEGPSSFIMDEDEGLASLLDLLPPW
jgi:hypothetical protein